MNYPAAPLQRGRGVSRIQNTESRSQNNIKLSYWSSHFFFWILATEFFTLHAFLWPKVAHLLRSQLPGIRPIEIKELIRVPAARPDAGSLVEQVGGMTSALLP